MTLFWGLGCRGLRSYLEVQSTCHPAMTVDVKQLLLGLFGGSTWDMSTVVNR